MLADIAHGIAFTIGYDRIFVRRSSAEGAP